MTGLAFAQNLPVDGTGLIPIEAELQRMAQAMQREG
jgi:hypothetical protein